MHAVMLLAHASTHPYIYTFIREVHAQSKTKPSLGMCCLQSIDVEKSSWNAFWTTSNALVRLSLWMLSLCSLVSQDIFVILNALIMSTPAQVMTALEVRLYCCCWWDVTIVHFRNIVEHCLVLQSSTCTESSMLRNFAGRCYRSRMVRCHKAASVGIWPQADSAHCIWAPYSASRNQIYRYAILSALLSCRQSVYVDTCCMLPAAVPGFVCMTNMHLFVRQVSKLLQIWISKWPRWAAAHWGSSCIPACCAVKFACGLELQWLTQQKCC